MPALELFLFRFRDPLTGRMVRSRYRATRAEIERRHPGAEVLEDSIERRQVPDEAGTKPWHMTRGDDV
jgi:hypothetical protein